VLIKAFTLLVAILAVFLLGSSVAADDSVEGRAGRAEVRFLQGMIDHHQMALDMAQHCLERASTPVVVDLCQNVIDAQSAEISQMQGWLLDWYGITYTPMSMLEMMEMMDMMPSIGDMGHSTHGGHGAAQEIKDPPMMMGMMAGLNRLEGHAYEVAWLEAMIDHHDDALHMSRRILRYAEHDDLRALAEDIISAQTKEIELMEQLIVEIGG
jgi:uncharacterized protein (DUF305 family)